MRERIQSMPESWRDIGARWRLQCRVRWGLPISAALATVLGESVFARPATAGLSAVGETGSTIVDLADAAIPSR